MIKFFIILLISIINSYYSLNCISCFNKHSLIFNKSNIIKGNNTHIFESPINITNIKILINKLNLYSNQTNQSNIIFADNFISKICYDKSAYTLFEYYLKNNLDKPYYIINNESDFFQYLLNVNKTRNLIVYSENNLALFYGNLFKYLKNTKIIINAYSIPFLQKIVSFVPYIKYLKINHGIKHFKVLYAKTEFVNTLKKKMNVICSSPYEYELLTKELNYSTDQIHNASLIRYDRFRYLSINKTEKKCILMSFTYRSYSKDFFQKSVYKKNLDEILDDKELILFLTKKNIDLIYIPHHQEIYLGKNYSQHFYEYAKIKNQSVLEHYIEHCSLLITDFSSISFDFMFQNKPVLFFHIDKNEKSYIIEKKFMASPNDTLHFGNYYQKKKLLIDKIKYYAINNFNIGKKLKQKYESVFFFKTHIIETIVDIINNITKGKFTK